MTKMLRVVKETQSFWEEQTGEPMSEEEARETIANITGYFKVLARWDSDSKKAA